MAPNLHARRFQENKFVNWLPQITTSTKASGDNIYFMRFLPSIVVVTGPSGCGKSTLLSKLLSQHPNTFSFSCSHTTRGPRPAEQHGSHYWFIDQTSFQSMINKGEFVEYAQFGDHFYGTSKGELDRIKGMGRVAVLDVDRQGVESLKKEPLVSSTAMFIFIKPPSFEDLKSRLLGRKTESEASLKKRLDIAEHDLEWAEQRPSTNPGYWDKVIVNDQVQKAYEELEEAIFGERVSGSGTWDDKVSSTTPLIKE